MEPMARFYSSMLRDSMKSQIFKNHPQFHSEKAIENMALVTVKYREVIPYQFIGNWITDKRIRKDIPNASRLAPEYQFMCEDGSILTIKLDDEFCIKDVYSINKLIIPGLKPIY